MSHSQASHIGRLAPVASYMKPRSHRLASLAAGLLRCRQEVQDFAHQPFSLVRCEDKLRVGRAFEND